MQQKQSNCLHHGFETLYFQTKQTKPEFMKIFELLTYKKLKASFQSIKMFSSLLV